jgi:DNA-binding transcriptional MerR regulator
MTPELLHRALREAGLATDGHDMSCPTTLLDRLYALQRNQPYRAAFATRLQAAGWSVADIAQALEEVPALIEELRAQGAITTEELQERQLAEARARHEAERAVRRRRLEELEEENKRLLPVIAKMGGRKLDIRERTVVFLTTCHMLRYKHRSRRVLLELVERFWGETFTVSDVQALAQCSRPYALRLISYAQRLKVVEVARAGTRGRGRATLYRFRFAQQKNVTISDLGNQSKENIALRAIGKVGRSGGNGTTSPLRRRRCQRVTHYVQTEAPIVYREPVRYRYPFWRDLIWWTRHAAERAGLTRDGAHLVAAMVARRIVGTTIIRAYEYVRAVVAALRQMAQATLRRLLWMCCSLFGRIVYNRPYVHKWFITLTPEERRRLRERRKQKAAQTAQTAQTENVTNAENVTSPDPKDVSANEPAPEEMPKPKPIPPDAIVDVDLYRSGWQRIAQAVPVSHLAALLARYVGDLGRDILARILADNGRPVLVRWEYAQAGVVPVYVRVVENVTETEISM